MKASGGGCRCRHGEDPEDAKSFVWGLRGWLKGWLKGRLKGGVKGRLKGGVKGRLKGGLKGGLKGWLKGRLKGGLTSRCLTAPMGPDQPKKSARSEGFGHRNQECECGESQMRRMGEG